MSQGCDCHYYDNEDRNVDDETERSEKNRF